MPVVSEPTSSADFKELGDKHTLVGTVHGYGLYLGLEFVRDRVT